VKLLSLVLTTSALLMACGHQPTTPVAAEKIYDPSIWVQPGERGPAQAPTTMWQPAAISLLISDDGVYSRDIKATQVMMWQERVAFTDTRYVDKEFSVASTCTRNVCSGPSATSPRWEAVFKGKKSDRAKALADAVQGFGPVSAEALINNGYFISKPKSWKEFSATVSRAADAGVIRQTEATKVLQTYQAENVESLGYKAGSCQAVQYACQKWVTRSVLENFTNYRTEERKQVISTKTFSLAVTVENTTFLPNEMDSLMVYVDEKGNVSHSANSSYNDYSITSVNKDNSDNSRGQQINVTLTARRIQIDLPNKVIRQDDYRIIGGKPTFTLDVDNSYLLKNVDPEAQLVLDYEVQDCKYGWTGTCGFSSWETLEKKQLVLTNDRTTIQPAVKNGYKSQILYSVSQKASRFYNDRPTAVRETDEIKTAR
jgi:hypothetical protein